MKILMVLTSHDQLGNTGQKTGFWLEEFAAPYFVFRDAGVELTLASPKGGQPPLDPKSDKPENQTPAMTRFKNDATAKKALANTVKLADMKSEDFDTVFYPGGHGPMWDLAESPDSIALQLRQDDRSGLPFARRAAPRNVPGRASGKGKTRDRLYKRRGGSDATH
jgi:putative intracellular protease/amidase